VVASPRIAGTVLDSFGWDLLRPTHPLRLATSSLLKRLLPNFGDTFGVRGLMSIEFYGDVPLSPCVVWKVVVSQHYSFAPFEGLADRTAAFGPVSTPLSGNGPSSHDELWSIGSARTNTPSTAQATAVVIRSVRVSVTGQ